MDYSTQFDWIAQEFYEQQGLLSYEESIPVAPDRQPPEATCGQCQHYVAAKPGRWGYCGLRAQADLHPCNFEPWSKYAVRCPYYVEEVPF
jgi:hypothetical protein